MPGEDDFFALMGSPNASAVAYMLAQQFQNEKRIAGTCCMQLYGSNSWKISIQST
jgi:hypothetical protein